MEESLDESFISSGNISKTVQVELYQFLHNQDEPICISLYFKGCECLNPFVEFFPIKEGSDVLYPIDDTSGIEDFWIKYNRQRRKAILYRNNLALIIDLTDHFGED